MTSPTESSQPAYSEPSYAKSVDRAKFPFYQSNIEEKLVPETRRLLEEYSRIPPEQQSQHVHRIRDLAWDIRAYPCTGIGAFLVPQLCKLPVYPEILKRVKSGEIFLDIGCFIGHDLRRLAFDSALSSTTNLYGVDIVSHWNVGYEMFHDKGNFEAHFIEADVLSVPDPASALSILKDKVDIVSILQVIHQWDWDGQVKALKALIGLSKPQAGSMIVGNQIGNQKAQEVTLKSIGVPMYRQNPESFKKLWSQVGRETGTRWETEAWMRSFEEMSWNPQDGAWMEPGVAIIEFAVRRVE